MILFRELFAPRSLIKLGLLCFTMSAFASGVGESVTWMNYDMFFPVALFGLIIAWILAFNKRIAGFPWDLILVGGFVFIIIHVGHLWGNLGTLVQDLRDIQAGLIGWLVDKVPPDLNPIQASWRELLTRLAGLLQKIVLGIRARSLDDPTVRELLWDIPVLAASAWAGWTLKRRTNALLALGPIVAILAYVLYYSSERPFPLQITLGILLLLTGMNEWEKKSQEQPEKYSLEKAVSDANRTIVILSLGIALVAGWIPSISVNRVANRIAQISQQARNREVADALGLEKNPDSTRTFTSPTLPREHLIGTGNAVTAQNVVFTVQTGELRPMPDNELDEAVPRYYWRSVSYDIYNGRGWETTLTETVNYPANQPVFEDAPESYRLMHLQVKKVPNVDSNLYWTGMVLSVDRPFRVGWRAIPGSLPQTVDPLSGADPLGGVINADQHQVTSLLPTPTIEQLRAAGQAYPEAIRQRYLELPTTVPARVRNLAAGLTADSENPYDKARAIEAYLRTYPYTLDVPPPPQEGDIADYFLFELLTGYCDYYATAMVVMARSAGLPARLVSGYASGSYLPSSAEYVVRQADAHSWVEIYFPDIGWVEFEPTASQPQIERPVESDQAAETPAPIQTVEDRKSTPFMSLAGTIAIIAGILIIVIALGISLYLVLKRSSSKSNIQQIYRRVFQQGNKLAPSLRIHETPLMFAARLGEHLGQSLPRTGMTGRLLAPASSELSFLTDLYVRALYSPRYTSEEEDAQARDTWRRLYWRLLLARVLRGKPPS